MKKRNYIAYAYAKVGSVNKAISIMDVSHQTAYDYRKRGRILKPTAALALAKASGIPVAKLIGG